MSQRMEASVREPRVRQATAGSWRERLQCAVVRTHIRWLIAILALALAVRLVWLAFVLPDPADGRVDDAAAHYQIARALADGAGFVGPDGVATAGGPPGYPSLLAAAFLLPGDDVIAGIALNVAAGAVIVLCTYYLGSRLWDRRAGLIAAGITALFPSLIFSTSILMKELVFTATLLGVLCLTLAWTLRRKALTWHVSALGALVAFAGMVRPEGFALAFVVLGAWAIARLPVRRLLRDTALLAAGAALLIVPWTVRNIIELDAPVVSATGGAFVLVDGHHEGAKGRVEAEDTVAFEYALRHRDLPPKEREVRIYEEATRDAIGYFLTHPASELRLAPDRLAWFFRGDRSVLFYAQDAKDGHGELSSGAEQFWSVSADAYYYAVAGLMVFAVPFWILSMRREHALLWGVFASYVLLWAFVFVGQPRYHIPLLPVFAVLAGIGVSAALASFQTRDTGTLGPPPVG